MNAGSKATVLLVDDDPRVRRILRKRLELGGYRVIEAVDADAALAAYRSAPADVVITDVIMPGKSGHELINELREDFPQAKIIAISGALDQNIQRLLQTASEQGALRTLPKPFTTDQLLGIVDEVLR